MDTCTKAVGLEILDAIHSIGGCDATEAYDRGWDAAVAACEEIVMNYTGLSYNDLEAYRMKKDDTE